MSQELTDEEKKARRAEINRQNAQKSTGPKTEAGRMNSRINSLRNGSRTVIVDHTGAPGLALLSGEDIAEYRAMVAEYSRYLSPRDRVETGIVQRIVDAQWRQLRNSRLQTLELESCLADARETEYPGWAPTGWSDRSQEGHPDGPRGKNIPTPTGRSTCGPARQCQSRRANYASKTEPNAKIAGPAPYRIPRTGRRPCRQSFQKGRDRRRCEPRANRCGAPFWERPANP